MVVEKPVVPESQIETEIARIRQRIERSDFASALTAAEALRIQDPKNRDALYMVAVSQRLLQRISDALATLAQLEKLHPAFARLYQERGHCYVSMRSAGRAIEAFERAVAINNALPASWNALQALYGMVGRPADARYAAGQIANLATLPKELATAFGLFADGDIQVAERVVRQYLLTHGDHIEGMRLLAKIGIELDVVDDAELLLAQVLVLAPDYDAARYEYAVALLKRHKHVRAKEELEKLLKKDPNNRVYLTTHATVCTGFGDFGQALPRYRELLREAPNDPELHLSIGHSLKTLGRTAEAVEAYRTAAASRPQNGEAYWSLANLKTYRFTDAELGTMRADESAPNIRLADRYHMCFALGKALEDRQGYAESFEYYTRGNALKKTECRYRPEHTERNARLQAATCTREFFGARIGYGAESLGPIFIVGLPRAGSTLIEQILASHSRVEGTMELAEVPRLVQDLGGRESTAEEPRYPRVLAELSAADFKRMGEAYLTDTLVYRTGERIFIDKMPNNFRHLALIHLMLPRAKIIDARRNAMACCFSNFKQLFASGQQFTYSVDDIARYYRAYVELMAHWDDALPGRVLRVQHEELVRNFEPNVRRILDYCELDFEPQCLEFYKSDRPVHSASSEQVRRPITHEGLEQWRHFERWLKPLREALGALAEP